MISLGIEYSPPPTKEEIRAWRKWKKEMNKLMEIAPLKQAAAASKKKAASRKRKTTAGKKKVKRNT
ncbi:MAG: hypothetical protein HY840_06210 [Bacteroidetes bacterium]|nr:hypothetical protein [Bacteroidota bacterium]